MKPHFPAIYDGTTGRIRSLTRPVTAGSPPQSSPASDRTARLLERLIALFALALSCGATTLWFGPFG